MVLASATPAAAYYERFFVSARAYSLGGAFVAIADDATSTVLNPAGLTQVTNVQFVSSLVRPYEVGDLEEHFLSLAVPNRYFSLGLSWHRFGIRDVAAEDLFTIAVGRDLIRTSEDASLSIGGSLDIARVSYKGTYDESQTRVTGSLSVLLRPFPIIGIGYNIRNLGQPSFDLVEGGGSTPLRSTQAIGLAYYWQNFFLATYERTYEQDREWRDHLGIEVNAGRHLRLRSGLFGQGITGGLGVMVSGIAVDAAMTSDSDLGVSYAITIGIGVRYKGIAEW